MDASQLPEGVTLYYTDKAVHLTTNDALMTFLRQKGNGSLPLSRTILAGYEAECGAALQIHAYLDGVFAAWVRAGETRGRQDRKFYRTARRLKNATAVIDMGERSVDTNRWVFDLLSHGYGALCLLLGRSA